MFHKNIKLILAGLIVATGIWQITDGYTGNGIFLILVSAIPVFLYFKNEFILLAFLKLRKQDFEGAKKWLDKIKNPEGALVQKQQGYFRARGGERQGDLMSEKHLQAMMAGRERLRHN